MDCPHCNMSQPEGVECVQCHMPLGELADLLHHLQLDPPVREHPLPAPGEQVGTRPSRPLDQIAINPEQQAQANRVRRVRMTTGPKFSGLTIRAYRGLVSAQVLVRLNPTLLPANDSVISLRATEAGAPFSQALAVCVGDLRLAVVKAGGNAVISVHVGYHPRMDDSLLLTLSGTAVEVIRAPGQSS